MMTTNARIRRLIRPASGRSLVVALDHGFFGVAADLPAIEDLDAVLTTVCSIKPDGVLMSAGQAPTLPAVGSIDLPALTMRADVTNLYLGAADPEDNIIDDAVERALRQDAAAVLLNLLDADDDPRVKQACLRNIFRVKAQCERYGMPLMVEPIPFVRNADGGYRDVADADRLVPMVRQAVEAGADIIKAGILSDSDDMKRAIRVAGGRPYLARGGSKADDIEVLNLTRHLLDCGAGGVVFGRNIFQHDNPAGMAAALRSLIHDDASVDTAKGELA